MRKTGIAFALAGAFGFSAKAILIKMAYARAGIDASTLLALRMLFALPFFLWMAFAGQVRQREPITRKDWMMLAWLGCMGYYLSSLFDFLGLQYISAALERLILFTYPAVVLVCSALFLGKSIHGREIIAVALSFAGIATVFVHDLRLSDSPRALWTGGALVFLSSLLYSAYLIANGNLIRRLGSTRFTGLTASISSVYVVGHFLCFHPAQDLLISHDMVWLVLALSLISTAIPIWMTTEALRRIGPSHVAIAGSVGPVLTILLSAAFLEEAITGYTVLGALMVLGGVMLVSSLQRN